MNGIFCVSLLFESILKQMCKRHKSRYLKKEFCLYIICDTDDYSIKIIIVFIKMKYKAKKR